MCRSHGLGGGNQGHCLPKVDVTGWDLGDFPEASSGAPSRVEGLLRGVGEAAKREKWKIRGEGILQKS